MVCFAMLAMLGAVSGFTSWRGDVFDRGHAILHDAELTYSLVVHGGHPLAARRELLYQAAHVSLVEALADFGITAALWRTMSRAIRV